MARSDAKAYYDREGNRRGFVSKQPAYDDYAKTRYGVGIDNVGSPYRGISDNELNTLLGKLDYGYDGDTVYAGFTPNVYGGVSPVTPLASGGDLATAWAGIGDYQLRGNRFTDEQGRSSYHAGLNFPDDTVIPDFYKEFNTPFGQGHVVTNDGNPNIGAGFLPNEKTQAYVQALSRALSGAPTTPMSGLANLLNRR